MATDREVQVRFRRYQMFLQLVGLERGPLSLVSTIGSYLEAIIAVPVYEI
jgi:hypothetical protein